MTTYSSRQRSSPKFAAWCLLAALALAAPFLGGCVVVAAGAAGAGAVAYVRGELESSVPHDLDATFAATQRALGDMKFARIDDQKTAIDAKLISRTALDKKIEIQLERVTEGLTKVHIRVGLMGDQQLSLTILEKITAELK
jgi:Protein of unknown function (DUF3568)